MGGHVPDWEEKIGERDKVRERKNDKKKTAGERQERLGGRKCKRERWAAYRSRPL